MCESCEVVNINGCNCHEIGCPDTWKDVARECLECGQEFIPNESGQKCCDNVCAAVYYGWYYDQDCDYEYNYGYIGLED